MELEPQNLSSGHQIGRVYQDKGEFNKSLESFDQVLKVNPNMIPTLVEKEGLWE